ncbi:MAG TPA: SH3 domain-containing protein, partial [Cyclobacteriaceae bacterium]|nr:SH3 domain-containing protein [Cyclobacteriaceae bacterium]
MNGENYGVCRLALVQVKAGPDDRAGQVTQLLFGDHYEVLEYSANGLWLYIKIFNDGQEGWIAI